MDTLQDKVVVITGGASGLGRAIATEFIGRGAKVALTDLNTTLVKQTAKQLNGQAQAYTMDVTSIGSIEKARKAILKQFKTIDILVNNAGVVFGGSFRATPLEKHLLTYQINLLGQVRVTHIFFPDLILRPQSHIVFISSASGYVGLPYGSSYASSKWGIIGFVESIRAELKLDKLSNPGTTLVCPSYIQTGMFTGVDAPILAPFLRTEDVAKRIVEAVLKNKEVLDLPLIVNWLQSLRGILPYSVFQSLLNLTGVTRSMLNWQGHKKP